MARSCLCEHNAQNTHITVRTRRGQPGVTFPIVLGTEENGMKDWTASMIAAMKFFRYRGEEVTPLDQHREHKLERNGTYVARVRIL